MSVYSHSKENKEGVKKGSKLLLEHLQGVFDKAIKANSNRIAFDQTFDTSTIKNVCWLHDFGKYTQYFQKYLLGKAVDPKLKSHSSIGAHTAFNILKDDPIAAIYAFYIIKSHHSNLENIDDTLIAGFEKELRDEDIVSKQIKVLNDYSDLIKKIPQLNDDKVSFVPSKDLKKYYTKYLYKKPDIQNYFQINYLFSLLIESDKLDASDTLPHQLKPINPNAVEENRFGKPQYDKKLCIKDLSQKDLRNYVRSEVLKTLEHQNITSQKIFTLAAPTGIGKTITALDFSLKLRQKLYEEKEVLPQIIYALPFINIIEQGLDEYRKTLPNTEILAHYQYADIFGSDNPTQKNYNQQKMSWDTWQSDIVITSFVQFFETLIGNRNKLLKKFNHLADAIVILDEVQTLALKKLPLIAASIQYCAKFLNTNFIIMTATQPRLFELAKRELNINFSESSELEPKNLLENDREVFECFNRTKIVPFIEDKINNDEFLDIFSEKWSSDKSCLIVVNKVSRSVELFNLLENAEFESKPKLFYLSTNITPTERKARIDSIGAELEKQTCIVVSTQVVEAGVDLDFDMGFRDLGPIDSIIQVAGRINRENDEKRKGSPVYITDFGDCSKIYGFNTEIQAINALKNKSEIPEIEYKNIVEDYFENLADPEKNDFSYSKEIFKAMKNLKYGFSNHQVSKIKTVSDFKIIEESQNGISVFVEDPENSAAFESRKAYQKLLDKNLKKAEFDQNFKKDFHQQIIAVPDYLIKAQDLKKQNEQLSENIYWVRPEEFTDYYNRNTGFIRSTERSNEAVAF